MNRAVPRTHVIDRVRIWRVVAVVLLVAGGLNVLELWARPETWELSLASAAFPVLAAPLAWRYGPRLSPLWSHRIGLGFLALGIVATTIGLIAALGTPVAGAAGLYYLLIVVFAALFFHRRHVVGLLISSAIAMAIGLLADGFDPDDLLLWALAVSVSASTGLVLHDVSSTAQRLSYTDALTGAANRREWDLVIADTIDRHDRLGGPIAVVLIDIDDFKAINDTSGHERGDEVLHAAVAAWRTSIRSTDTLARLGGDEFAILLPGVDARRSGTIGRSLLDAFELATGSTCSVGIASTDLAGAAPRLLAEADRQLYRAKAAGRGCIRSTEIDAIGHVPDLGATAQA